MGGARGIRLSANMLTATFGLKVSITLKAHYVFKPLITTIFPRIYARMYYAQPRARVMSFSAIRIQSNVKYYQEQSGRICKMKMVV